MESTTNGLDVRWMKTGNRYMLGHTQQEPHFYGIWARGHGSEPTARFPFSEHGKSEAIEAFIQAEPNSADVSINGKMSPSTRPGRPDRDAWVLPVGASAQQVVTRHPSPNPNSAKPPGSGMAVTSLVIGILGILIPLLLSVPAIVFGGIGISNANSKGAPGKGMAIAGLVLGILGTLGGLAMLGNLE